MGIVKKILAMRDISPVSTMYSDHFAIDLSENFHLHWRNTRMIMDDQEFRAFLSLAESAKRRWESIGEPAAHETYEQGDEYFLARSKIKEHAGSDSPYIANEGIRVELLKWADLIHIHWKWTRFEFDYSEFLEFADAMAEAAERLRGSAGFQTAPRRIGSHHTTVPRDRVDKPGNGEFWTAPDQDAWIEARHRTIFLDPDDAARVNLPNVGLVPDSGTVSKDHRVMLRDAGFRAQVSRLASRTRRVFGRFKIRR